MSKQISFFLVKNDGNDVRQTSVSRSIVIAAGLLGVLVLVGFGLLITNYIHLKRAVLNTEALESQISSQLNEIAQHQKHIQSFENEIKKLQSSIGELGTFENQVRSIANLEPTSNQDGLIGIGGTLPDSGVPPAGDQLISPTDNNIAYRSSSPSGEGYLWNGEAETLIKTNLLSSTPSLRPVRGQIAATFAPQNNSGKSITDFYPGMLFSVHKNTPVVATADGTIAFAGHKYPLGPCIVIDHGYGIVTRYGHVQNISKRRGEHVKKGDIIAKTASNDGNVMSTVSYEILLHGLPVNPHNYILN